MMEKEPEEFMDTSAEAETTKKDEVKKLKQALAEETKKAESYLANWQRAQADFINFKRRTEQEREEQNKLANAALLCCVLPILDDMELALNSVPPDAAKPDWMDGIRLIERKLRKTLEAQGLCTVKALGEPFDPRFHEAVRQDKGEEGKVVQELQKGYMLHDRLLRPAQVVVGSGEEEEKEE